MSGNVNSSYASRFLWWDFPLSWLFMCCAILAPLHGAERANHDQARFGVLTLISGETVEGSLRSGSAVDVADQGNSITWQGVHFVDPFQFRLGTIRSIKYAGRTMVDEPAGEFVFEFKHGDVITGDLAGLSEQSVEIETHSIGVVSLRRDLLYSMHRIDDGESIGFSSLRGLEGWRDESDGGNNWQEDGDQLLSDVPGASLFANALVPERAVVEFELSWEGAPDFVLVIGADANAQADTGREGWRLETSANSLVMVHEEGDRAYVDDIAELSGVGRIRIVLYLDQRIGMMEATSPSDTRMGRIARTENEGVDPSSHSGDANRDDFGGGIRIVNRGESLRLERLHVARWVGAIPGADSAGRASIALSDGGLASGHLQEFDAETGRLKLASVGGVTGAPEIDIANVRVIRFTPTAADIVPHQCAWFLHGRMRLSGNVTRVDEREWVVGGDQYLQDVVLPHELVRSLVVFESDAANVTPKPVLGRIGRLELGDDRLSGRLVESEAAAHPDSFPVAWHALNSSTAARIRSDAMGKVIYRDPPKTDSRGAAAKMLAEQRLRNQQQRRGLNFGELFLLRADLSKTSPSKRDAHVVHLRSGDVIACRVDSIEEKGVVLSTAHSDGGFVPHEQVKAIEFVSNSPPPSIDEAKRDRLLTIPRLQKSLPPSHLLCSHNGDFLRCRLIGTFGDLFRIEVQSRELQVPRNRIAQIIWFRPDENEWSSASSQPLPSIGYQGLVQAVLNDGKRVTFALTGLKENAVEGTSQWVGKCRFDLGSVDQLLFGSQIAIDVSDVSYNQFRLRPAVEPLVTAEMQGDGAIPAHPGSSLVGSLAPAIRLPLLDGDSFDLAECRGQTVVLGFWTSWSAASMQTIPLVTAAVAEFDPSLVRLVYVNLQEPSELIRAVVERHGIDAPVILDSEGVLTQPYQVSEIPQWVLVGADGQVKGLLVGAGAEVVERLRVQIQELIGSAGSATVAPLR